MKNRIEHLRERYDTAFQSWAEEIGHLQRIRSQAPEAVNPGPLNVECAELRATTAETTYRETRDQLAKEISLAARA